ncbi:MAG: hypothetical protein ACXW5U_13915 [Thermoanaerobaculia bacterium]
MPISYNPDADRLEGGDFFRDLQGHPVLQMLLSMRRAKALCEAAKDLKQRYDQLPADPRSSERPFSEAWVVLQIEGIPVMDQDEQRDISVDELFSQPALADAPPEYRDLCQMILVVPGNDALADSGIVSASQPASFARQLFRTLGCAHLQAQMTFARSAGSCISPTQLTAKGEVIDVYYLTRSSETKRKFVDFRKDDLRRALTLCSDVATAASADVMQVLQEARQAYRAASKSAATSRSDESWRLSGTVNRDEAIDRLVEDLAAL